MNPLKVILFGTLLILITLIKLNVFIDKALDDVPGLILFESRVLMGAIIYKIA